jgi:hypothetical protein
MAEDQYRMEAKGGNSQAENCACLVEAIHTEWRRLKRLNTTQDSGLKGQVLGR